MKKLLVLVLSIMFVAGAFTPAVYADHGEVVSMMADSKIMIGGDARVRGTCKYDYNTNDDVDDDNCYWDQRVRLKVTGQIGDAEVRTRFTTEDPTKRGVDAHSTVWSNEGGSSETGGSLNVDYAYLHIPVAGFVIDAGRQLLSFGNHFYVDGLAIDAFAISANTGDVTVGAWTEKEVENNGNEGFFQNDVDYYGIIADYKAGDMAAGVLVRFRNNDAMDEDDGTDATVYISTKAAGLGVKGEVAMKTGDANYVTADEDTQWGGFISADMGMDALTLGGVFGFTQNGFVADKHFAPVVMIGRDNSAAMENFGARGDSLLGVISADFQATPELTVGAKAAYATYDEYAGNTCANGDDCSAIEIDAGLNYQISKGVSYSVDLGYLIPDDYSATDDNVLGVRSMFVVNFN